ncbi:MAG: hypothetical protein NVS3B5_12990 [Sphingomicrobium sp.]
MNHFSGRIRSAGSSHLCRWLQFEKGINNMTDNFVKKLLKCDLNRLRDLIEKGLFESLAFSGLIIIGWLNLIYRLVH